MLTLKLTVTLGFDFDFGLWSLVFDFDFDFGRWSLSLTFGLLSLALTV